MTLHLGTKKFPIVIEPTEVDNLTIIYNSDNKLQNIAQINANDKAVIKTWVGTKSEYDALIDKTNMLCYITDEE